MLLKRRQYRYVQLISSFRTLGTDCTLQGVELALWAEGRGRDVDLWFRTCLQVKKVKRTDKNRLPLKEATCDI